MKMDMKFIQTHRGRERERERDHLRLSILAVEKINGHLWTSEKDVNKRFVQEKADLIEKEFKYIIF